MEAQHRVDLHRPGLGPLAHHLPVKLRFLRHIDEEVAAKARLAPQSLAAREGAPQALIAFLDGIQPRHMVERRGNVTLLIHAFDDGDPAPSADATPAADRIEIDAEPTGGLEHARPFGKAPTLAGGREGDGELVHALGVPITSWPGLGLHALPYQREDMDGRDQHGHDGKGSRLSTVRPGRAWPRHPRLCPAKEKTWLAVPCTSERHPDGGFSRPPHSISARRRASSYSRSRRSTSASTAASRSSPHGAGSPCRQPAR